MLVIVQGLISERTKEALAFQNSFRLNFYVEENFTRKMMVALGFANDKEKPTFKHQVVNEVASKVFRHDDSHYS